MKPEDFCLRHSCAHWYLQPVATNPDFSSHVLFTSKAAFVRSGTFKTRRDKSGQVF